MKIESYLAYLEETLTKSPYPEAYSRYLKLNHQRFHRIYKTFVPSPELKELASKQSKALQVLIILEPWCGDVAQNVPVLLKIMELFKNVQIEIQLRDEESEIDQYLTHGGKSIPIVVFRDENGIDLCVWGPRLEAAQILFLEHKSKGDSIERIHESMHTWYALDKGKSLSLELLTILKKLN